MTAPESAPRDMINVLDGYVETARRLVSDFGINLRYASLENDIGIWDGEERSITIDADSPVDDQLWLLIQVWQLCAIGPSATPAIRPAGVGHLRVVHLPAPRPTQT